MVRCGEPLDNNAIEVRDPLIVVEVVSQHPHTGDSGTKLSDYFRIASVRHYLIIRAENLSVIHHRRDDAGDILTRIITGGPIQLDPPGIELTLAA
jgi:Uma2 family endonuclease